MKQNNSYFSFKIVGLSMSSNEDVQKIHVFTWEIKNFSMCSQKKGEKLVSPIFKAKCFDDTAWCLSFYPRGRIKSDDGYISLFLTREKDDIDSSTIECDFIVEIIDKNCCTVATQRSTRMREFELNTSLGWRNYMKIDELTKTSLHDDTLIIRCRLSKNLPNNFSYSQNTSTTKFKISNRSLQLVVRDLNSITGQGIIKFPFSLTSQAEITVQIPEDDLNICILIHEKLSSPQFLSCEIKLLDIEGKERDSRRATHLFEKAETWKFPSFIKRSQLNAEKDFYVKDGCFTLRFDIAASDGSFVEDIGEKVDLQISEKFTVSAVDTANLLNDDFKRMYADKIHTDINLKAGKEVFPAHKSVLCARSPVFSAMFDSDMAENQKGEVDIHDLDANTVALFLEYIYTGTLKDLDCENAVKLIVAADKYQILLLKNQCADLLKSKLTDANVCDVLVTADMVQHSDLKAAVINYIKMRPEKIFKSEEWKHCLKNNVSLAAETASEVTILLGNPVISLIFSLVNKLYSLSLIYLIYLFCNNLID